MSVLTADPDAVPAAGITNGRPTVLSGFGRTRAAHSLLFAPHRAEALAELLAGGAEGVIARGAGQSYGDAAQLDGGAVIELLALGAIESLDADAGMLTAQAGARLGELQAAAVKEGWMLPVLPGTANATLGGAIASDVHGKNHHCDGSFGAHVESLVLLDPDGGRRELRRGEGELGATIGGMGLTGVIEQATIRLKPLASTLAVDTDRVEDLDAALELLAGDEHRYSIAWLDLFDPRARGVVTRANETDAPAPVTASKRLSIPTSAPVNLIRAPFTRLLNEARFRSAPRRERGRATKLDRFLFPLDAIAGWNLLYGPAGLIQYQFAVPTGADQTLRRAIELVQKRRLPVHLATLKRLGEANSQAPLSFPLAGHTLALDFAAGAPALETTLTELDELVAAAGGRVYLTKDARLPAEMLARMYPRLHDWRAQREKLDPRERLRSDLGARLGLCPPATSRKEEPMNPTAPNNPAAASRVLLLGGTSEIGLALVRALPATSGDQRGRVIVLAGRDAGVLDSTANKLADDTGATVRTVALDAADTASHRATLTEALDPGQPTLAIVAVGTLGEGDGFPTDVAQAVDDLRVNFLGTGSLLLETAAAMRAGAGGTIVVLSSVAGLRARASNFVYGAAKAGLDALAQGMADALHDERVRVLVVRPGFVHTRMTRGRPAPPLATSPEAVADAVLKGLERGSQTVFAPRALAPVMLALRLLPRPLFRRLPL